MKKIKVSFILKESIMHAIAEESDLTRDELFEDEHFEGIIEAFVEGLRSSFAQKVDVEVIEEG